MVLRPDAQDLFELAGPDVASGDALRDLAHNLPYTVRASGWPAVVLLGAGAAAWLAAATGRGRLRTTPLFVATAVAAAITLVVFTDWGASYNHLLDLLVLSVLAVGALVAEPRGEAAERRAPLLGAGLAALALLAAATTLLPDLADVGHDRPQDVVDPLAALPDLGRPVLTEDPLVALEAGQEPVVLDPYMYRYVVQTQPALDAALVARIDAQEFAAIVLDHELSDDEWYEHFFSPGVLAAIGRAYELDRRVDGRYVFVPV